MSQTIENIEKFKAEFNEYYKYFTQYYSGYENQNSEFYFGHNKLIEASHRLQAHFLKLPLEIRERLLDIEFDVFLHCNNIVDLYSLRNYIVDKNLFYNFATIVERADGELNTAIEIFKIGDLEMYKDLPKRNYSFFVTWETKSIINKNMKVENNNSNIETENIDSKIFSVDKQLECENDIQQTNKASKSKNIIEKLEEVEKGTGSAEKIIKSIASVGSLILTNWPFK